jgi:glucose/arabinose dehydrogenase
MIVRILPLLAALMAALPAPAGAQLRATLLATGFDRPNTIVVDPMVPGAVYVVDQIGLVRAFLNGVERPTPFLDLRNVVSGGFDERGLLGMAFPPDGATSGRVFVHFTNRTAAGNSVVRRYTRSAGDPMVADPASAFDMMWPAPGGGRQPFIVQPFSNHNGGNLVFGPDGYLYIGLGDGGSGNDPNNRAQTGTTLLGKMLRIDVSGNPPNGYTIPQTNPTFPVNALPEIWAFGLRNPWRYSFDDFGPGATNSLIIADVGQGDREEIDYEPPGQGGRNYGWRVYEGDIENPNILPEAPAYLPVQTPVFAYSHALGQAITGGYVYRGTALGAAYQGRYFYADCVSGRVWSLQLAFDPGTGEATGATSTEHTTELGGPFNCIAGFFRDPAGELYFTDFDYINGGPGTGRIHKIELASPLAPGAPTNLAANVNGDAVTITWSAPTSGGAPIDYELAAGSALGLSNIATVVTSATSLSAAGVPTGQYFLRVRARNAVGTGPATADLAVAVGCTPAVPPATFTASVSGSALSFAWDVAAGTIRTELDAGVTPGTTVLTVPFAAPAAGIAFPGVPSGTYYVRARAVNACGTSGPSVERTVIVP